jgi:uncharacterized protein (DUF1697 family)
MPDAPERVVALLRGVNVGGVKVPMGELRSLLAKGGLGEVQTHLQSGNVIVTPPSGNLGAVAGVIEKAIRDGLGLSIRVMVRDRSQMARIVAANPLLRPGVPPKHFHAIFLDATPAADRVASLDPNRSPADRFSVAGEEIFVEYGPAGSGRSKLDLSYFEKVLGVTGTARNWNTVTRLLAMLEELDEI